MDPATAIGLAASIAQLLDLGIKVAKRFNEYAQASPGDTPKALENINTILPLITQSLARIKSEDKIAEYDVDTRTILHGVVLGCLKLVQELNQISDKAVLKHGEGVAVKMKKVLQSFKSEEKIQDIEKGLQAYIQVLILHQVVNKKDVPVPPPTASEYFEVKEILVKDPVERPNLISCIHGAFINSVHGLNRTPVTAVLRGAKGAGKSQIALQYCYKARDLKHFPWIFWLQSASPGLLRMGLEQIASVIRQSTTGSSDEKINFVKDKLNKSWHPWLLVLDNYEPKAFDSKPLSRLLPDSGCGAILMTTRHEFPADLGIVIQVYKLLTPEEGPAFRYKVTQALWAKDMSQVVDAMTMGLDPNSYSNSGYEDNHQPLINVAAEQGFDEAVQLFLDMGADPYLDKKRFSALGQAVYEGHLSTVELCLDHQDKTGYCLEDEDWNSITRWAISKGNPKLLQILLDRRGEKIIVEGQWPEEGFTKAVKEGDIETLRLLLSRDKFPKSTKMHSDALQNSIERYLLEVIKFLIQEAHVKPSVPDSYNALVWAVGSDLFQKIDTEDRNALIDMLIKAGADVNSRSRNKGTALHNAAVHKLVPAMQFLLERGADPTVENGNGETALEFAAGLESGEEKSLLALAEVEIADAAARKRYYSRSLRMAAWLGWRELALRLLKHADINTHEKDTREPGARRYIRRVLDAINDRPEDTPLAIAIRRDHVPMARMLIRRGADQNIANGDGKVPLLLAAEKGMDAVIKELAKAKDSPGLEVGDQQGRTALMLAAANKDHAKTVEVLLTLGADKDAMNTFGDTALDVAEEAKNEDIIKLLEA